MMVESTIILSNACHHNIHNTKKKKKKNISNFISILIKNSKGNSHIVNKLFIYLQKALYLHTTNLQQKMLDHIEKKYAINTYIFFFF